MGKKKKPVIPDEQHLSLPPHPRSVSYETPIVDTHTHLLSTFAKYRHLYPSTKFEDVFAFVKGLYGAQSDPDHGDIAGHKIGAIVDVWCEAPVLTEWQEMADSALSESGRKEKWGGIEYWFVMGVHPHDAKHYNDDVERDILAAMEHPRCVGWGEIGLDYHYDNSPHEIQQSVFVRQLRHALRLGKPVTIHTREAEDDTERILKEELPQDHRIHIHCFTDSWEFGLRLLAHFPNLFIGITGVITYSTNLNTAALIRNLVASDPSSLRILLETDAPYMTPSTIYRDLKGLPSGNKLPLCHTGMVPWTAEFVADAATEGSSKGGSLEEPAKGWNVDSVMREARENARKMYGV